MKSLLGALAVTVPTLAQLWDGHRHDTAGSRIFVQFTDSSNNVRGETSVAVETR